MASLGGYEPTTVPMTFVRGVYSLQRKEYIELTYKMYFVEHNLKQKAKSATQKMKSSVCRDRN